MGVPGNNNYFVFIISRRVLAISPRCAVVFPQRPLTQKKYICKFFFLLNTVKFVYIIEENLC